MVAAFEMLLEEIEAEIEFTNKIGARAFEAREYQPSYESRIPSLTLASSCVSVPSLGCPRR
jgi:hypothetical protein